MAASNLLIRGINAMDPSPTEITALDKETAALLNLSKEIGKEQIALEEERTALVQFISQIFEAIDDKMMMLTRDHMIRTRVQEDTACYVEHLTSFIDVLLAREHELAKGEQLNREKLQKRIIEEMSQASAEKEAPINYPVYSFDSIPVDELSMLLAFMVTLQEIEKQAYASVSGIEPEKKRQALLEAKLLKSEPLNAVAIASCHHPQAILILKRFFNSTPLQKEAMVKAGYKSLNERATEEEKQQHQDRLSKTGAGLRHPKEDEPEEALEQQSHSSLQFKPDRPHQTTDDTP